SAAYAQRTGLMIGYDITFSQLFVGAGAQHNVFLAEGYTLGFQGGVSLNRISQTLDVPSGIGLHTAANLALTRPGAFVGLVLERNFGVKPISVYLQPLYNYAPSSAFGGNQGGGFMTVGLRYYFGERTL
ncbi:MAG TPA: hypothetical protein VF889_09600, partial [Bacteroidota bacterium]